MIAELSGTAANARILLAAAASEADVLAAAGDRIVEQEDAAFDMAAAAVRVRATRRLGAIELSSDPKPARADDSDGPRPCARRRRAWASTGSPGAKPSFSSGIASRFCAMLGRTPSSRLPDLSDDALAGSVEDWLAPFLARANTSRRHLRRRSGRCSRRSDPVGRQTPARCRNADAFRSAHGQPPPHRLRQRACARCLPPRAGAVWLAATSRNRQWPPAIDADAARALRPSASDHARSARLLERFLGRCQTRDARPLSEASLARRSRPRRTDRARQAAASADRIVLA